MSHNTRKSAIMPSIPDGFVVVAPDDPGRGYLQICREGVERTLCDLPLQSHWGLRQPEEFEKYLMCLECLKALETLPKLALEPVEVGVKLLTVEEIAEMRAHLTRWPDQGFNLSDRELERVVVTLEALIAERDEWHAAADEWARAYEEAIGG